MFLCFYSSLGEISYAVQQQKNDLFGEESRQFSCETEIKDFYSADKHQLQIEYCK